MPGGYGMAPKLGDIVIARRSRGDKGEVRGIFKGPGGQYGTVYDCDGKTVHTVNHATVMLLYRFEVLDKDDKQSINEILAKHGLPRRAMA